MERNGLQRQDNPSEAGFPQPSGKDIPLNDMASSVTTPSLDRKDFSAQAKTGITGQSSSGRKRKRDDAERVRVTRACDRCKAYVPCFCCSEYLSAHVLEKSLVLETPAFRKAFGACAGKQPGSWTPA